MVDIIRISSVLISGIHEAIKTDVYKLMSGQFVILYVFVAY